MVAFFESVQAPGVLRLKEGCQVMLLVNLSTDRGLANGSIGIVTGFHHQDIGAKERVRIPLVKFELRKEREVYYTSPISIGPATFTYKSLHSEDRKKVLCRKQLPLSLAWATTIHKAQGRTIDPVIVDIRRTFCAGQGYVGLTRARSVEGLQICGYNIKWGEVFWADPGVEKFQIYLQKQHDRAHKKCVLSTGELLRSKFKAPNLHS